MLQGIIFDMDGTITKPKVDFAALEREVEEKVGFVLDHAERSTPDVRARAMEMFDRVETEAALESELNDGVHEILDYLSEKRLKRALFTRNCRKSVEIVLKKNNLHFEYVISRDDARPKPAPDAILLLSKMMKIHTDHLLMVGDYKYDIMCGRAAGTKTVLLRCEKYLEMEVIPDFEIDSLREIIQIIERG